MRQLFNFLNKSNIFKIQVRYKNPEHHWSVLIKKKFPTDKALEFFDKFYKSVYQSNWESIRTALLSKNHKYMAVVNNFSGTEDTKSKLQDVGALNLKIMYDIRKEIIEERDIQKKKKQKSKTAKNITNVLQQAELDEIKMVYPEGSNTLIEKLDIKNEEKNEKQPNEDDDDFGLIFEDPNKLSPVQMKSIENNKSEVEIAKDRIIDGTQGLSSSGLFEFIPPTKIKGLDNWVLESDQYNFYKKGDKLKIEVEQETTITIPECLNVYAFEQSSEVKFPNPRKANSSIFEYYLFDGSSILPVLALDLQAGDTVLDMCAAPGGKSLAILQTLMPKVLVANDVSSRRVNRIKRVFSEYLSDNSSLKDNLFITKSDARYIQDKEIYNKILVDAPCTTDRHSLHEDEENYFDAARIQERLRLPELQSEILTNALKIVATGGTVVYSTCSLNPIQNEGVVKASLEKIWQETDVQIVVKDMSEAIRPLEYFFKFRKCPYGHLVIPTMENNWGPMYFCKMQRIR